MLAAIISNVLLHYEKLFRAKYIVACDEEISIAINGTSEEIVEMTGEHVIFTSARVAEYMHDDVNRQCVPVLPGSSCEIMLFVQWSHEIRNIYGLARNAF